MPYLPYHLLLSCVVDAISIICQNLVPTSELARFIARNLLCVCSTYLSLPLLLLVFFLSPPCQFFSPSVCLSPSMVHSFCTLLSWDPSVTSLEFQGVVISFSTPWLKRAWGSLSQDWCILTFPTMSLWNHKKSLWISGDVSLMVVQGKRQSSQPYLWKEGCGLNVHVYYKI